MMKRFIERCLFVSLFLAGTTIGLRMRLEGSTTFPASTSAHMVADHPDEAAVAGRIAPVLQFLLLTDSEAAAPDVRVYIPVVRKR